MSGYDAYICYWFVNDSWSFVTFDLLFQLAASRSLYFHIEDANFSEQDFSDLLSVCWDSCFKLVEDVQEFDSKVSEGLFICVKFNL